MPRHLTAVLAALVVVSLLAATRPVERSPVGSDTPRTADRVRDTLPEEVTFTEHLAPILFRSCSRCHRPRGPAPFSVLSYEEAKAHASQMARMTADRRMPPWLPEPGYRDYADDPSLSDGEIELFRRWAEAGAPRGVPDALPEPPPPPGGWELGEPELVVSMPEAYAVPREETDVFRNFVLPVPLDGDRWVEAVEIQPGSRELVHHAVLMVDRTESSRRLAARESGPGFGGMHGGANAHLPEGFFVGWTPGKRPAREVEGAAWPVDGETDLVLQLHLRPTGRAERIRA